MKKFLYSATIASSLFVLGAFAAVNPDTEMTDATPQRPASAFDMSSLQEAIDEIAYKKNATLTYEDFVADMFRRYTALQADIIRLQIANPTTDFSSAITEISKAMTSLISSEDMLNFNYIIMTRKFNSEQDITPEIFQALIKGIGSMMPGAAQFISCPDFLSDPGIIQMLKSAIFQTVKAGQQKREAFFKLLLTNPDLKHEFDTILSGQRLDLSESFFQGIKNITLETLRGSLPMHNDPIFEAVHSSILSSISENLSKKRSTFPLLIKHFGGTGLGII